MDWITGIQRALDYTEAHLTGEVDYEEAAREACSSAFHFQRMFTMVYVNDKPLLLVCDNTVFEKILPELSELMSGAQTALPYEGGKEHYILDIEDKELTLTVIAILEPITPLPKPKKKRLK